MRFTSRRRRARWILNGMIGPALLTGCGHKAEAPPLPAAGPAAPSGGASWVGKPLHGNDAASLRAYLQSVEEVKPRKFDVHWSPAVVAFDKAAAVRSLRGVSSDGALLTIASNEPALAQLKPGSIIWVWDICIRRVDAVAVQGDDTLVRTSPVALTEAMPNAEIDVEAAPNLKNYYISRRALTPAAKTTRVSMPTPRFLHTSFEQPGDAGGQDTPDEGGDDDWFDKGLSANGVTLSMKGWSVSMAYSQRPAGITVQLQGSREDLASNLETQLRFRTDVDGFSVGTHFVFTNGSTDTLHTEFKNLNGTIHAQYEGRLGSAGNQGLKVPVMNIPVAFSVPFPVGGVPLVIQVGADFNLTLFLSGMNATITLDGEAGFHGDTGVDYVNGNATAIGSLTGNQPHVSNYRGISPGVSAVVIGVQLPRIGVGVGVFGVSSVAYVDFVSVLTLTNSAGIATLSPACKHVTYAGVAHIGVQTDVTPIPIAALTQWVNSNLSAKREVVNVHEDILDPPATICEIAK